MNIKSTLINTPLGQLRAIADDHALHALHFEDVNPPCNIPHGLNAPIISIQTELADYFEGKLTCFKTPLHLKGTAFQQQSWQALIDIPFGQTRSYLEQAKAIQKPKAFRAVANANGKNPLVIVVPCHRVVNHNGKLGGFSAGLHRKEWLLAHECAK